MRLSGFELDHCLHQNFEECLHKLRIKSIIDYCFLVYILRNKYKVQYMIDGNEGCG